MEYVQKSMSSVDVIVTFDSEGEVKVPLRFVENNIYTMYLLPTCNRGLDIGTVFYLMVYEGNKVVCNKLSFALDYNVPSTNTKFKSDGHVWLTFSLLKNLSARIVIYNHSDIVKLHEENLEMKKENRTLKNRLHILESKVDEIYYAPGMPGYYTARDDFKDRM